MKNEKNEFSIKIFCINSDETFADDGGLTVYSAKNLSDELGFIACKIKNDVLSGKYRYSDIAIAAVANVHTTQ